MLQLVLDTRDVKMGNEDTWVLCFDDKSGKFFSSIHGLIANQGR